MNRFLQNVPSTGSCVYQEVSEAQERGADHHHGLHARARDDGLRDRRAGDGHPGRGEGEPGLERRVAEDGLHIEGEQEEAAEDRRAEEHADGVRQDRPDPEEPERHDRRRRPGLPPEESSDERDRESSDPSVWALPQPASGASDFA